MLPAQVDWGGRIPMDDLMYLQVSHYPPYFPSAAAKEYQKEDKEERQVTCMMKLTTVLTRLLFADTPPAPIKDAEPRKALAAKQAGEVQPRAKAKAKPMWEQSDYCDEDVPRPEHKPLLNTPPKAKAVPVLAGGDFAAEGDLPSPTSVLMPEARPPKMRHSLPAAYEGMPMKRTCDAFNDFQYHGYLAHW